MSGSRLPDPLPQDGHGVFVLGAGYALGANNVSARFVLFDEHVECRVLVGLQRFRYAEIESVSLLRALFSRRSSRRISIKVKGRFLRLYFQFASRDDVIAVLRFLATKRVQLDARAVRFLAEGV
jgi:hypothetical protein